MISKEIRKSDNWQPKTKSVHQSFVCNWCGSDEVYEKVFINMNTGKQDYSKETVTSEFAADCCGEFDAPVTEDGWYESVFDDCQGNKYEIEKIMEGSRT